MMFNASFNNISVEVSLLVEETWVPVENGYLPQVASHWQTLSHNVVSNLLLYVSDISLNHKICQKHRELTLTRTVSNLTEWYPPHLQYYDVQTLEYRYISKLIISPFKFWTATIFLHAYLQVVYYNCVKFHKTPISRLGGVALTRYTTPLFVKV